MRSGAGAGAAARGALDLRRPFTPILMEATKNRTLIMIMHGGSEYRDLFDEVHEMKHPRTESATAVERLGVRQSTTRSAQRVGKKQESQ